MLVFCRFFPVCFPLVFRLFSVGFPSVFRLCFPPVCPSPHSWSSVYPNFRFFCPFFSSSIDCEAKLAARRRERSHACHHPPIIYRNHPTFKKIFLVTLCWKEIIDVPGETQVHQVWTSLVSLQLEHQST